MQAAAIQSRAKMTPDSLVFGYRPLLHVMIWLGIAVAFIVSSQLGEWTILGSAFVLLAIWKLLPTEEGPPVLPLALTYQWLQVSAGMLYYGLTGRKLKELATLGNIRTMVWIGLGCLMAMALGLWLGKRLYRRSRAEEYVLEPIVKDLKLPLTTLYFGVVLASGIAIQFAWRFPGITQAIIALFSIRYIFFYLMLRRYSYPRLQVWPFFGYILFEVALGATGYFANFREPLMIGLMALLETSIRRGRREHWVGLAMLLMSGLMLGVVWSGIKAKLRVKIDKSGNWGGDLARIDDTTNEAVGWFKRGSDQIWKDTDKFASRLWSVYYPAKALKHVPAVCPHQGGALLKNAILHILKPRLFFPKKPVNPSDSVLVRKYAGVFVSSKNTSIAFGYAAQSYVDYGLPWMFFPMFVVGIVMGYLYRLLLYSIYHRELAIAMVTVIFWSSLYLFEQSWVMLFGRAGMLIICLFGVSFAVDRHMLSSGRPNWLRAGRIKGRGRRRARPAQAPPPITATA